MTTDFFDATFMEDICGQTWHVFRGKIPDAPSKLGWAAVNTVLQNHWHDPQIVRLAHHGRPVPLSEYVEPRRWRGHLVLANFNDILKRGASLVIEDIASWIPSLFRIALAAESELREPVETQLFISGPHTTGFGVHWDPYDVFALQLIGSRHWSIYQPTREAPMLIDKAAPAPAESTPTQRIDLQEGDLLYLPRGWWHNVEGSSSASAHMTIIVPRRTGVDFLQWIGEEIRTESSARKDLTWEKSQSSTSRIDDLRRTVGRNITVDKVEEFLTSQDLQADGRAAFSLPWMLGEQIDQQTGRQILCLVPRAKVINRPDACVLLADGKELVLHPKAASAIHKIITDTVLSVVDLVSETGLSVAESLQLLNELTRNGMIAIED